MVGILIGFILLQFVYILYQDIVNRREREKLELKLLSRDVGEYKSAVEEEPKEGESEEDPYVPVEDVPADKLLEAEDNL